MNHRRIADVGLLEQEREESGSEGRGRFAVMRSAALEFPAAPAFVLMIRVSSAIVRIECWWCSSHRRAPVQGTHRILGGKSVANFCKLGQNLPAAVPSSGGSFYENMSCSRLGGGGAPVTRVGGGFFSGDKC